MSNEKEKILDRNGFEFEAFKFENEYSAKNLLLAMQEYADQQTSDLQKRIKELEDEKNAVLSDFLEWYRSKQAVNTFNDCNNTYIIEEYFKFTK